MVGRKLKTGIAIMMALVVGMPAAASACDISHGVRAKLESGSYRATLNGVFVDDRGFSVSSGDEGPSQTSFEYMLTEWLVPGKNILKIDFDGSAAEFEIFARCKGEYDDHDIVDTVRFTSSSSRQLSFEHEGPLEDIYLKADIAGDEGLLDALKKLQDAARSGDVETIVHMHAPMIEEFGRVMGNSDGFTSYLRTILSGYPADITETLTVTPVMGGRVYQILGPDGEPPISVSGKMDGGSFSWPGGAYWARFGDEWAVVAN
ncbi:hypothetical protein [Parasphingorhabdus sp.]|uniref:hypothetical protein n=1 Tax=Parasphingorhabdus sp. TaxID=2709688 RepID=UPI003A94CE70